MTEADTPPAIPKVRWIKSIGESRIKISHNRNRHFIFYLGIEETSKSP
jgi:hypothetical protein